MKIVHITQFLGIGGLEKVLNLLIIEQMKAGHDVELIVYDHEKSWVSFFREQGIRVNSELNKSDGFSFKLINDLKKATAKADIIHTHDLNPLIYVTLGKVLSLLNFSKHPKIIHTAHGMDHISRKPVYKWYERFAGFMTDRIIGVSQNVCDIYLEQLWLNPRKLFRIDNGTSIPLNDNSQQSPDRSWLSHEFSTDPNKKTFVCVARVIPLKNQKIILELANRRPDLNFLIIGPAGDASYWGEIEKEKPANFILAGARSDIGKILQNSDYFISASLHEGIPVAVLEAGSYGLPCFLSRIPGHLIIQEKSEEPIAVFFDPKDIEDLCIQIRILENNHNNIGLKIKKTIYSHFSSHKMSQEYLRLYEMKNV